MPRWNKFLLSLLFGLIASLLYGWLVNPVEFVDTTPDTLSADYQADYVLMVAEVYATSTDLEPVIRALALLSPQPPVITVAAALTYAQASGYSQTDIALLQNLTTAVLIYQPGGLP
jgi:hypothetical protein